ncbi:hypothetical protein LMG7974_01600 [Campylobacter majalis]|uniref:Cpp29 n=1 Tax=Campylobacter majalis TaxID=2790656 RepID=A0ABM8Q961_9BACT|nr:hypothetical protein [Campylobacter majalis]CAD7289523.1 hypothetical protein LMG7974_01600 [Campylobacter majalis]
MRNLGVKIVMDEDKILRENKYTLDEIYHNIDELAKSAEMIKQDKFTYLAPKNEDMLSCMGIFILNRLTKKEWFTKNVKEWDWLENGNITLDLIKKSKEYGKGVWE